MKSTLCTQEMKNAYLIQMHRKEEKMMRAREDEALGPQKPRGPWCPPCEVFCVFVDSGDVTPPKKRCQKNTYAAATDRPPIGKVDTFSNYLRYVHGALLQVWGVSTENWLMSSCFGFSTKAIEELVQRLFSFGCFSLLCQPNISKRKSLRMYQPEHLLSVDKVLAMCFSFNDLPGSFHVI